MRLQIFSFQAVVTMNWIVVVAVVVVSSTVVEQNRHHCGEQPRPQNSKGQIPFEFVSGVHFGAIQPLLLPHEAVVQHRNDFETAAASVIPRHHENALILPAVGDLYRAVLSMNLILLEDLQFHPSERPP